MRIDLPSRRALPVLLMVLLPGLPAAADGGFFSFAGPSVETVATSADQRAIIMRCGDRTLMTLSTGYTGNGDGFAWLIPTPVPPAAADVREAGTRGEQAFDTLDAITSVKVLRGRAADGSVSGVRGASPDAGSPQKTEPLVEVHARFTLAHYEVSILGSTSSRALLGWLQGNGYAVNLEAQSVLDAYIAQRWSFVAVRLRPDVKRLYRNEFLPPIAIGYDSERFVFPLRISSVSTAGIARITLYLIAESTVSAANAATVPLRFVRSLDAGESPEAYVEAGMRESAGGRNLALLWSGAYDADTAFVLQDPMGWSWYEADDFFLDAVEPFFHRGQPPTGGIYLTRLEARMDPSAMTEDIVFSLDEKPRAFSVLIESARMPGTR
jgi:hypothetical protein